MAGKTPAVYAVYRKRHLHDPVQRLKDKDKKRKAYYQLYSDRKWGAMENYHVALDSGALGLERCAEIIVQLF